MDCRECSGHNAYTDERDPDLFTVAAQVAIDERSLRERIATLLAGYQLRPTPFTEAIVRCPSHFIVTLNYDLLLEETAVRAGLSYRSLVGDEDGLEEAVRLVGSPERWPPEDLVILHLHGSVEEPDKATCWARKATSNWPTEGSSQTSSSF